MERIDEHCRSCGYAEESGLIEVCTCPCHTHEDRRCQCGGVRELVSFKMTMKLNLKGEENLTMAILNAICHDCGEKWDEPGAT